MDLKNGGGDLPDVGGDTDREIMKYRNPKPDQLLRLPDRPFDACLESFIIVAAPLDLFDQVFRDVDIKDLG